MRKIQNLLSKGYRIVCVTFLVCGLFLTGCGPTRNEPEQTIPTETDPQITNNETLAQTGKETVPTQTEPAAGEASLTALRQAMVETPQIFAVAYLGYPEDVDQNAKADPFAVMQKNAPGLSTDLPFLLEIPQDRIVGQTGELFCIVPKDENATISVARGIWDDACGVQEFSDVVYQSEKGDPILLFCNNGGWEPDTQVVITDAEGTQTVWYPQLDDNKCAMPLRNDDWEELFFDFSPYREMLLSRYRTLTEAQWIAPTADTLTGRTWVWSGYLKDGREVSYRLIFMDEVLSVFWNDGIDEMEHEYLYAPWELIQNEGFTTLSIDFGEFAGVLRYHLLYQEEFGDLYVAMDAAQGEMSIGLEPLYRFLSRPIIPEPTGMIGTWELAWTEVEGDRNAAEPGECTITIMSAASGGLLMSYTSRNFPDDNFENELMTIDMREMHHGCGNDVWVADLDYIGPYDTTYTVTLTADEILIKQNYFLLDGAPSVSYEYFRRVTE